LICPRDHRACDQIAQLGAALKRGGKIGNVGFKAGKRFVLFRDLENGGGIALGNAGRDRSWFGHVHPFDCGPTSALERSQCGGVHRRDAKQNAEIGGGLAEHEAPSKPVKLRHPPAIVYKYQ